MFICFFKGGKDALTVRYDGDEEINLRQISLATAKEIYVQNDLAHEKETAFVFDDIIKSVAERKLRGFQVISSTQNGEM